MPPGADAAASPGGSAGAAPADGADARVEALSERLICHCGCGNRVVRLCYCGTADALRQEIRAQLGGGATDAQVLAHFVGRYGEQILASPAPRGFNLAAWIAPSAALAAGAALAALLLWRWRRRTRLEDAAAARPPAPVSGDDPYEQAFEAEYASRRD